MARSDGLQLGKTEAKRDLEGDRWLAECAEVLIRKRKNGSKGWGGDVLGGKTTGKEETINRASPRIAQRKCRCNTSKGGKRRCCEYYKDSADCYRYSTQPFFHARGT